ncbi:MAG: U4/U6-U5 snRNP complex subunit prp31 [Bathelium mastoideum]|nr:MAG: U4/U6-U5 snRNP complex subunit prp31 [Bathelium mastoideum]
MATLADELLNDFEEDDGQEEEEQREDPQDDGVTSVPAAGVSKIQKDFHDGTAMELDDDEEEPDDDEDLANGGSVNKAIESAEDADDAKQRVEKMQLGGVHDVRSVAVLMKSLEPVLEKIAQYQHLPPEKQSKNVGSIEDNPEYKLLTQSNTMSTQIDSEIILVHKFIRDHYSVRFPELETLISNPLDYAKTVAIIGNGPMDKVKSIAESSDNMVGQSLRSVLDGPSLMVVTVESTTTRGREMRESELQTVRRACEMTLQLDRAKHTLTSYVQSRMNLFAPNLTALIGSLTAAQLLNYAGGLTGLAKTPACNIAPLGSKKQSGMGFATNVGIRHQGFLYHSELIRNIPTDLKKQAMRIVSSKVILAARVDHVHSSPDGSTGEDLRTQCLERLEKLTEPPPNKGVRALPAPDDKPSRKRGGRRARKAKEATAMTDLRKSQNRMAFGKEEAEVGYGTGDSTKGMGMLGQEDRGKVRREAIDQRTRAKLSKKNPGWGGGGGTASGVGGFASSLKTGSAGNATTLRTHGLRTAGVGGTATAGTASSIAFAPTQGLELVDPKVREEMNRKEQAEKDRWFKGGTFTQVGGGQSSLAGSAGGAAGGFKVPALPRKRKLEND